MPYRCNTFVSMDREPWEVLDLDWGEEDPDGGEELLKHVTKHGPTPFEIESVVMNEQSIYDDLEHPLRRAYIGPNEQGDVRTIVLKRVGESTGRPLSARPASKKERAEWKEAK